MTARRLATDFSLIAGGGGDVPSVETINRLVLRKHRARDGFSDQLQGAARSAVAGFDEEAAHRDDLRHIPFVTIDGEDARDFDDAVFCEPDLSANNRGGHYVYVAIADVAHYVRPGSPLDTEAYRRGFSIYMADRAAPMLPPLLSAQHCSLQADKNRLAVVKRLRIDSQGEILEFDLKRAVIRSRARLTYNQVDDYANGDLRAVPAHLHRQIEDTHHAYEALKIASENRDELNLEIPKIVADMGANGQVAGFQNIHRFYSRDVIGKLMVAANLGSATVLAEQPEADALFRAHAPPSESRIARTRTALANMGIDTPSQFWFESSEMNSLIAQARNAEEIDQLQNIALGLISKSHYVPRPLPHYGIGTDAGYATLTSPIRRWADLHNQRKLLTAFGFEPQHDNPQPASAMGSHLNRLDESVAAIHKELQQRYALAWLAQRAGQDIKVKILGETNREVAIGFEDCPFRHTETSDNLYFPVLKRWLADATLEQRADLILPIRHADVATGHLTLGLDALLPQNQRPESRPYLKLIS